LASLALALFAGAFRTHSSRFPYRGVDSRPYFFVRIVNFAVFYLHGAQSVSVRGGVIVQAINHNMRMRGASLDGAAVNSKFARYLSKVWLTRRRHSKVSGA
jgi:hypothetical protein